MDARLPGRRLNDSRASTRYGVSLLERSLLIGRRSVLLSGVVAINLNQCPVMTAGWPSGCLDGRSQKHGHSLTRGGLYDGDGDDGGGGGVYTHREGEEEAAAVQLVRECE